MKKFLGAILVMVSMNAMASVCQQNEAQVIGKVTSVRDIDGYDICVVKMNFSYFRESSVCPIDISTADGANIMINNCNQSQTAVGSTISGILVEDKAGLHIDL